VEDTDNSGIDAHPDTRNRVINVCAQNENLLRSGPEGMGYIRIGGTRYHPFDWYGKCIERAKQNPEAWAVLIRCSINRKDGGPFLPGEFPAEDDLIFYWPEFPQLRYKVLREKYLDNYESFMCFRAGCQVLMADWTEKPIEQVQQGDEVVGFEKTHSGIKFKTSRVLQTFSHKADVAKVTTDKGRITYPTFDHRYLRPLNGHDLSYGKLHLGAKMVSVYTPRPRATGKEQRDFDWLGGLMDGEGSISRTGICIYQQQASNPEVYAEILEVLKKLSIVHGDGLTHTTERFSLAGGRSLLIHLLQNCRMAKCSRILQTLWSTRQIAETCGRRGGASYPVVSAMESIGEEQVYDLETVTHNFICDGFAVHNCQQQNDPQGGNVPTFPEKLYAGCAIEEERLPRRNDAETFICWRPRYGGKPGMAKFSEGAAATVVDGKIYVKECWQSTYTPSSEAEKIVAAVKENDADGVMIVDVPGCEYLAAHIRNEAARRNRSVRVQWLEFEEDDNRRTGAIKQLEPLMKVGRVLFSTGMSKAAECRKQFVHFGLVEENGIIECISRFAALVPISQMRANMQEEEIAWQRRRREDALVQSFLSQQGMPAVDEQAQQQARAHLAAMSKTATWSMPPLPGGLDG
jgi:hypothetical protein